MSYILDALKKAERERGIAKVPTLETIHAGGPKSGSARWAATCFIIILLAAVTGLFLYSRSGSGPGHSSAGDIAPQNPAPDKADVSMPGTGALQDQAGFPQRSSAFDAIPAAPPGELPRERPDPSRAQSRREGTRSNPTAVPVAPPAEAPYSEARFEDASRPDAEESPVNRVTAVPAPGGSPLSAPLSEAVRDMQITIHLYSDVAENRKIFINGRKYAEGDYIDGTYLVESITPEGAVLTHEGTRAEIKAAQ